MSKHTITKLDKRIRQGIKSYYGIKSLRVINNIVFSGELMIDKVKSFTISNITCNDVKMFIIRHNGLTIYSGKL